MRNTPVLGRSPASRPFDRHCGCSAATVSAMSISSSSSISLSLASTLLSDVDVVARALPMPVRRAVNAAPTDMRSRPSHPPLLLPTSLPDQSSHTPLQSLLDLPCYSTSPNRVWIFLLRRRHRDATDDDATSTSPRRWPHTHANPWSDRCARVREWRAGKGTHTRRDCSAWRAAETQSLAPRWFFFFF